MKCKPAIDRFRSRLLARGRWPGRISCLSVSLFVSLGAVQGQDKVLISPLGNKVQLMLQTAQPETEYVLESQAKLMEGDEWASVLQFRGAAAPRPFVDALCGDLEARFFRLRRLLAAPPRDVSNFRLIDTAGDAHELYYQQPARAVAVVLAGANLASAIPFAAELDRVRQKAGAASLPTWIVGISDPASRDTMAEVAKSFPPDMPVLQDATEAVHRTLGTGRVPEVVLIATADWSMAYRGPIDDIIDTGAGVIRNHPYSDAVTEFLAAKPISLSRAAVAGESAGLRALAAAQYSTQIAPLLLKSCMPCHSPGNIAPWSMTNHAVIQLFSKLIKPAVLLGEMPPWHADPRYTHMENSKALTSDEITMLVDWIDRGSPRGGGPDPLATHVQQPLVDWPLGQPDAVISIPTQSVPAAGVIAYRYLTALNPFTSNVWLRAVAIKPGNRAVVHHALAFKGSISDLLLLAGGLGGFFGEYVPGLDQAMFPSGTGKLLRKGDNIVFQMHYTANGKATTDRTQLGLYIAPTPPEREIITSAAYDTGFTIPPGNPEVPVDASMTFSSKSLIYEISPHMHFRGKSARFWLVYPDGKREVLVNVPAYFFNWQTLYRLATPKEVPAGTQFYAEGAFDNSSLNRYNPDPTLTVRFGEQSWEEMFIGYINYSAIP